MCRLQSYRILMLAILCAGLLGGIARPVQAQTQPEPLDAVLVAVQQNATVGELAQWLLKLRPAQGVTIDEVEVQPFDAARWRLAQPVKSGPLPASGADISIAVIPQAAETVVPAVQLRYRIGQDWQQRTILGADAVEIRAVEDQVVMQLNVHQKKVRPGALVDLDLVVTNRSPLTLDTLQIQDKGSGLIFTEEPKLDQPLGPFQSSPVYHFQARVAPGAAPGSLQPTIPLLYTWKTSSGEARGGSRMVNGDAIEIQASWFETSGILIYLVGFLGGLIAAFVTRLTEVLITRRHEVSLQRAQDASNRVRAIAVLSQLVDRAQISATIGSAIGLSDLGILFSDAELFRQVNEMDLMGLVGKAWSNAERFNEGITKPGGAQRKDTLLATIDQLSSRLNENGNDRSNK